MSLEGQQLGEFEILERIGQGGMGAVYKARQIKLDRLVAIKTLQSSLADDADYIARFEQEAKAAAGLMHPNLVQVFSAGENEGMHWFAMEYVEGESAKVRLKRKGSIEPLEAIAIVMHVATALEYGWRKASLIHRDIKPDNIFLSEDGEVKLGDLGLAKTAGQTQGLTVTGHSMGTPHYISPEQVQSTKDVDLRADIYSLGCTLYHFLSGQAPFEGNSAVAIMVKHIHEPVPILQEAWPECPPVLNDVVGKMMQKRPGDRQQNYGEVITDLRQAYEVVSNNDVPSVVVAAPAGLPQPEPVTPEKPSTAPKAAPANAGGSKMPLYVGVAGGLLIIGLACFVILKPEGQKLTQAERRARDQATQPPAAPLVAPNATQTSPLYPRPDKWVDATAKFRTEYQDTNKIVFEDGWMRATVDFTANVPEIEDRPLHDAALRILFRDHASLSLRRRRTPEGDQRYEGAIKNLGCSIKLMRGAGSALYVSPNTRLSVPLGNGVEHEAVFSAKGDTFSLWLDGKLLISGSDRNIESGTLAVSLTSGAPDGDGSIKKIEYCLLPDDGVRSTNSPASSSPEAATKVSLFVNSLGMKFVPVPGTKVLFSIWDTRVQDYKAYADVNKVDDSWTKQEKDGVPVSRDPDCPVISVNWEEAQAFCRWLTERELKAGRIPDRAKYRLPTDAEWSTAAGLPPEPGVTPEEKSKQNHSDYPWGIGYPPRKSYVGNYYDSTRRDKYHPPPSSFDGYVDGFMTTSPVGSFPANGFGLYDMGGNVWQWCEDWFNADQQHRVVRGASWLNWDSGSLLLSFRNHYAPAGRDAGISTGFRCVLELPAK